MPFVVQPMVQIYPVNAERLDDITASTAIVGYVRPPTDAQNLNSQRDALQMDECEKMFGDQICGINAEQLGLHAVLSDPE